MIKNIAVFILLISNLFYSQSENHSYLNLFKVYDFEKIKYDSPGKADITFLIVDPKEEKIFATDIEAIYNRFIPASTFKIANSIIALETGVVDSSDFTLHWDSIKIPRNENLPESWFSDHTLKSAFQNSVVWFYQELARRIGEDRMKNYIEKFNYGNKNISGGIDKFWLTGDLRISPIEQTDFLKRFYFSNLDISERTEKIVKNIMIIESTPEYTLSGKTGTGKLEKDKYIAWLVGFLEKNKQVYFYCFNVTGKDVFQKYPFKKRKKLVKNFFKEQGFLN